MKKYETLEPVCFQKMSIETYVEHPAISRSQLMWLNKSPLHFWARYIDKSIKDEPTRSQLIGSALHAKILEPEVYINNFVVMPDIDRRTRSGKEKYILFMEEAQNKNVLTMEEFEQVFSMYDSLVKSKIINDLLIGGANEESHFWEEPNNKIWCKCRPDVHHKNMIVDLKTANDASIGAFRNSIAKYGYHLQAAMMQDGIEKTLDKVINDFYFVIIETSPPYAIAIYSLNEYAIEVGRDDYLGLLSILGYCKDNNDWHSYEIMDIGLPNWAMREY